MPSIIYLRDPKELITALNLGEKGTSDLLRSMDYFDYAGGIIIPEKTASDKLRSFPRELSDVLLGLGHLHEGHIHFRSGRYYLNFSQNNNTDAIRVLIPEYIQEMSDAIERVRESNHEDDSLETRMLGLSILDHKKHYSMCILSAMFYHMLQDEVSIDIYQRAKGICIDDINNFYHYLITGNLIGQGRISDDILKEFRHSIKFPPATPPSTFKTEGEPSARKVIIREMDHPMQITLFSGEVLSEESNDPIDFIVNPLNGALEIGYALKTIFSISGKDKVRDVFLVKYSKYADAAERAISLRPFVPVQLVEETDMLLGKRLVIIDDNVFTGETLDDLRKMCMAYSSQVEIAAVERLTDKPTKRAINFDDLDFKPISKLRYIERVVEYIKTHNLEK